MRYLLMAVVAIALTACIASSGIIPAGRLDTYAITVMVAPINGGGAMAQRIALTDANDFCQQQGRVFVPDNVSAAGDLRYPPTGSMLRFRCLTPNGQVWQTKDLQEPLTIGR